MPGQLDRIDALWPDRGIFQGSARAYVRYASKPQPVWEYVEKPLWEHVFSNFLPGTKMMDIGAGSGKLEYVATKESARGKFFQKDILTLEPNPILANELKNQFPSVRCRRTFGASFFGTRWENGFDLIVSNMVINHLDAPSFAGMFRFVMSHLRRDGIFAFTVPDPLMKARKFYPDSPWRDEFTAEEKVPWGGVTKYHHRSVDFYENFLLKRPVQFGFVQYGYSDSLSENRLKLAEREFGKSLRGPARLMVLVRKRSLIPDELLHPPTLRNRGEEQYELFGPVESLQMPKTVLLGGPHEVNTYRYPITLLRRRGVRVAKILPR